jgi:hypothetical protein
MIAPTYFASRMERARRHVRSAIVVAGMCVLLGGCRRDTTARWDVDVLAPLVVTTFTLGDLIADSLLVTGENGGLTLLYRSTLFAVDLDTVLQAPDTTYLYPGAITVPGPINFPAGTGIVNNNDVTRFDFDELALRELILREGTIELEIINMIASTMIGSFSLPGAQFPDGVNTLVSTVGAGTPSAPQTSGQVRDLAGVYFDLRGPSFNSTNTLHTIIAINLDPNGSGATVTDQDSVNARVTYSGLVPQYARGYFGNRILEVGPEQNDLGLFDNIISGVLDLDEVTLRVKITNGIGMDIQIALGSLQAVNTRTGVTVDLTHAILAGPINLNRATDTGGGYQPSTYLNVLDRNNSNVDLFLENLPDKLFYALELRLNPLGDISNGNDFLYYDSKLEAELELEVPLTLIANELTLQTFAEPKLPGSAEQHALQSGDLRLFVDNGFPLSARMELDIVNADEVVLSTVPVQGQVAPGVLGVDGFVQSSVASRLEASLSAPQVDLLYGGTRFRIRVIFNTVDQSQHLQLLDSYSLDLKIVLGANYIINGDE